MIHAGQLRIPHDRSVLLCIVPDNCIVDGDGGAYCDVNYFHTKQRGISFK